MGHSQEATEQAAESAILNQKDCLKLQEKSAWSLVHACLEEIVLAHSEIVEAEFHS